MHDNAISGYPAEYLWVVQLHAVGSSVRIVISHGAVPELDGVDRGPFGNMEVSGDRLPEMHRDPLYLTLLKERIRDNRTRV